MTPGILNPASIESFGTLDAIPSVAARFLTKVPDVDVALERSGAMVRLAPFHQQSLIDCGLGCYPLVNAEQVHGAKVAVVSAATNAPIPGVDGLVTSTRGITLGIYVADCAPVWIVSRDGSAGALLHAGKKGTELGIVQAGINTLCKFANLTPSDLVLLVGPCIRPPCYEVDFATQILRHAGAAGMVDFHDTGVCTACHPTRYYSYRRERGFTGRMLATLTILPL